jgi:hypothetical protein
MFGRDWESAEATIVTRRLVEQGHGGEAGILSYQAYEYIADVRPAGGSPVFRAVVKEPFNAIHFKAPEVGQVVRVTFRRKDKHVKFDDSDPGIHRDINHKKADRRAVAQAGSAAAKASFAAIAAAAPGTSPAPAGVGPATDPPFAAATDASAAIDAELQAASAAFDAAMARGRAAMSAFGDAKLAGDPVEAERLKGEVKTTNGEVQRANAEYQRVSALKSQSLGSKRAAGAAPVAVKSVPSDPLERLEKLADLRDRGVLSDAEFAAEKAKILSEG